MTALVLLQPVANGNVDIDLGRGEEAVAHEVLEGVEIDTGFVHVGGIGVTERVRGEAASLGVVSRGET